MAFTYPVIPVKKDVNTKEESPPLMEAGMWSAPRKETTQRLKNSIRVSDAWETIMGAAIANMCPRETSDRSGFTGL